MPASMRRFRPSPAAAAFVIAAALAGCATPAPLVRLYPRAPEIIWVAGRASVTREQGGVRVAVAFDHQDGGTLGMHVEVQNGTGATLDVDPSEFTFTTCTGTAVTTCGPTYRVIDPEQMLASLDARQSRERADAANSQALMGTLVVLSAVSDVATIASGHANAHTGQATLTAATLAQADVAARDSSLASISMQQAIWSNEALRRNTLFPARGAAGRVYIPIDLTAQIVWLHIRMSGRELSFPFQQIVTQLATLPAPSPRSSATVHGGT
ncbi:MAG TPA: hypothetical protein VIF57_22680 [Polyangia bacterium]|jgi:hypothetical protein